MRMLGALLLVVTLGLSCDILGGGTADPDPLLPLKNGNEWRATGGETGTIESAWLRILDGTGALRLVKPNDAVPYTLPVADTSGGLLVKWSRGLLRIQGSLLLKHPVEAGTSYQYADTLGTGRSVRISVAQDSVSVPAGTYECLIYTVRADTVVATASVKPGLGPVQVSLAATQDTLSLTSTTVDD